MRSITRRHPGIVTGLLTVPSLGIVVAVAGELVSTEFVPAGPEWLLQALPHLNAVISLFALLAISTGVLAIRRGDVATHRRRMLVSFGLFVAFLVSYLYRLSVVGTTPFTGPAVLDAVYLAVLGVHIGLAIICIPLVYYVLVLAFSYDLTELSATRHPRIGRIAAALWATSFTLGIVVYLSLYVAFPG